MKMKQQLTKLTKNGKINFLAEVDEKGNIIRIISEEAPIKLLKTESAINTIEQRVQTLESQNKHLTDEVEYFNLIFPTYADAINILKKRLDTLESKL